jgi:hypothetical protein
MSTAYKIRKDARYAAYANAGAEDAQALNPYAKGNKFSLGWNAERSAEVWREAFIDEARAIDKRNEKDAHAETHCPHCGAEVPAHGR